MNGLLGVRRVSEPDGPTSYTICAVRLDPEEHPPLERAGFHSPDILFGVFTAAGPTFDYDEYRLIRRLDGNDDWLLDEFDAFRTEVTA